MLLYDSSGTLLSFNSISGNGSSSISASWTATTSGKYFVTVSGTVDVFYQLSLNNASFSNMTKFETKGLDVVAGKNVTFSGTAASSFLGNQTYGLSIQTPGNITLLNVSAEENGLTGAYMDNSSGKGNVSVTGSSNDSRGKFYMNSRNGLEIFSKGSVTLNYLASINTAEMGYSSSNRRAQSQGMSH
jgi:hypothetical protein